MLSSGSIENCFKPRRINLFLEYFIITGHIDDLNESGRAEKAKKDRMTIYCNLEGVRIAGGKGGTVVWNQTVKALCYPSMCLMGSVAERSKALV